MQEYQNYKGPFTYYLIMDPGGPGVRENMMVFKDQKLGEEMINPLMMMMDRGRWGVSSNMMVYDSGGVGVKNDLKKDDLICEWPLMCYFFC